MSSRADIAWQKNKNPEKKLSAFIVCKDCILISPSCFRLLKMNQWIPGCFFLKSSKILKWLASMTASWTVYFCITYNKETRYSGDKLSGGIFHCCLQPKTQLTKAKLSIVMLFLKLWWLRWINLFLATFMVKHCKQEQKFCPSKKLSFR